MKRRSFVAGLSRDRVGSGRAVLWVRPSGGFVAG